LNSRLRMLLALFSILALALAACNGDNGDNGDADTDTDVTDTDTDVDTGDLGLMEEGTIVVGSDIAFEPFEFIGEGGEPEGFDIDLMDEIGQRLGLEIDYINTSFDTIFDQLAGGQFDAIISAITITEERQQRIDFTDPYFAANQAIAVTVGSEITDENDLAGQDVGVQSGTTGEEYANENFTDSNVVSFPNSEAAFAALEAGQIDAVFIDLPVVGERAATSDNVELAAEVDTDEQYGIGVQQGNDALVSALNDALAEIIDDGTYEEIYSRWFEGDVPEQFQN
jgi:ABC-type amino acid transport substrate-binding protein